MSDKIIVLEHKGETRELDMGTMPIAEAIECEQLTGFTWAECRREAARDRAVPLMFLWWLAGKRAGVDEKFNDLAPVLDLEELALKWKDDEASDDEDEDDEPAPFSSKPNDGNDATPSEPDEPVSTA